MHYTANCLSFSMLTTVKKSYFLFRFKIIPNDGSRFIAILIQFSFCDNLRCDRDLSYFYIRTVLSGGGVAIFQ